jgi:hypothetical protein
VWRPAPITEAVYLNMFALRINLATTARALQNLGGICKKNEAPGIEFYARVDAPC